MLRWSSLSRFRALAFLREPGRWSAAMGAVVLGTIALILADGFISRIYRDFGEDIVRSHFGHLQVLPLESDSSSPKRLGAALLPASLVPRIESAFAARQARPDAFGEGKVTVAARLSVSGLIAFGERTVGFIGEGVEPAKEETLSRSLGIAQGRGFSGPQAREVLLGEGLAAGLGVRPGEKLTLLSNTPNGGVNGIELTVVGLFYTATKAYDDRALRLPLVHAQALARTRDVSRVLVLLPETAQAGRASEWLRGVLAADSLSVKSWRDLADFYNKTVELFDKQLGVIRAVILFIVILSISNSMARNVLERTREIGTMMALGDRRSKVRNRFLSEGGAIGVLGAMAGIALGAVLAWLVSAIGIPMPPPPGMARGFIGGVEFTLGSAVFAGLLVVVAALLASVVPAWRASRIPIVDALRVGR